MSIRGPRSALSKFLEEENIKVDGKKAIKDKKKEENCDDRVVVGLSGADECSSTLNGQSLKKVTGATRTKRIRYSRPIEIVNLRREETLRTAVLQKVHANLTAFKLHDEHIVEYSKFLYDNRLLTPQIFDVLVEYATKKLVVYDCSMIEEFELHKNFEHLELHYCGQMKDKDIAQILSYAVDLRVLKLTGAFLLENVDLMPYMSKKKQRMSKLVEIDVSNCSRLRDNFITRVNQLIHLESLNISYCYGLTDESRLTISPKKIIADGTKIGERFFGMNEHITLEELSIANCPVLFANGKNHIDLCKFTRLRKLNIEGISEIKHIGIDTVEELRAANCFSLTLPLHNNLLKVLDISKINYPRDELMKLNQFSKLEYLNISFNENVDDDIVIGYITNMKHIRSVVVFGCFGLTKELGRLAWSIKNDIKIIGNHAETKYLLEN
ncbi:hypothetical protein VCUG_00039 [Vavraia culicis subsp. floridensis]|uniref:Uncharacterized protein n=1 Tax=Vavraia culicis (isolate floridensis) TaxID=948595 RepID=L2GZD4_VAVCU|nr:uncharacterized protein VCUG_00039 [Vavraia culicis subsp. floridensis]ELA48430.1 hypothetical protein VCUG_00039 [Vavraia culicis subsp. floridensis]